MRRKRVPAAVAILVALAATGGVLVTSGPQQPALAAPRPAADTVRLMRRTLSARVSQAGILTYRGRADGSPYVVINRARGIYTKLPAVGQVIVSGHVLYRVNNRPVMLLRGSTPAYRTLSAGVAGPDVAELNADLVALGYATSAQLHPRSAFFGAATASALQKLQASVGVSPTGILSLGRAVFVPAAVRVTSLSVRLGGTTQPGQTVLEATSTTRQVQVALDAAQQTEVDVGNKVSVTLPDNRTTAGVVTSVASVATCPPSSGTGGTGTSSAAPGTDSCSSGGSGSSTPTIAVDVALTHPDAGGTWDQAPVQVGITTASVRNALTVPVTALLARSGGGYAIELAGAGTRATDRLVQVSLGLFDDADGLVQISGVGLAAGQNVVVPAT